MSDIPLSELRFSMGSDKGFLVDARNGKILHTVGGANVKVGDIFHDVDRLWDLRRFQSEFSTSFKTDIEMKDFITLNFPEISW